MNTDANIVVIDKALAEFEEIDLESLNQRSALLERVERKYIVDMRDLPALLLALRETHSLLAINGNRLHRYTSTYFDTPDLLCFRAHNQQRSNRFKLRVRSYLDSHQAFFELKEKTRVSATRKLRQPAQDPESTLPEQLVERVAQLSQRHHPLVFRRNLIVSYSRITLASKVENLRLTIDTDLSFCLHDNPQAGVSASKAIIEVKSHKPFSLTDRLLREHGLRPQKQLSKYCIAAIACGLQSGNNRFRAGYKKIMEDDRRA